MIGVFVERAAFTRGRAWGVEAMLAEVLVIVLLPAVLVSATVPPAAFDDSNLLHLCTLHSQALGNTFVGVCWSYTTDTSIDSSRMCVWGEGGHKQARNKPGTRALSYPLDARGRHFDRSVAAYTEAATVHAPIDHAAPRTHPLGCPENSKLDVR